MMLAAERTPDTDQRCNPETKQQRQLSLRFDSPLYGKVKNERVVMVFNFFALAKERVSELAIYDDGTVRIEVTGTKHGVANMYDKDLLIYLASLLQEKINRNEQISPKLYVTGYDFFRACGQSLGGSSYQRLEESLRRLQGTQIKTNIETGGEGQDEAFSWLTSYKAQYVRGPNGVRRLRGFMVELCEWLFRAVVKDRRMLTYDPEYFKLSPIERRLYEIARAHCGQQPAFRIGLAKLHTRVGSDTSLQNFKKVLDRQDGVLPGYAYRIVDPRPPNRASRATTTRQRRVPLDRLQVLFYRHDAEVKHEFMTPVVED
jgi:plasmid replication initiation protein